MKFKLTISVITMSTQFFPVRGRLHFSNILCPPPFAICSIVTITFEPGAETRSIAPPIPLTIFPGIIQFARSPHFDTLIELSKQGTKSARSLYTLKIKLPGNHIAFLIIVTYLHCSKNCNIYVTTPNHGKTVIT